MTMVRMRGAGGWKMSLGVWNTSNKRAIRSKCTDGGVPVSEEALPHKGMSAAPTAAVVLALFAHIALTRLVAGE
jgi:hypothetical protein